MKGIVTILPVLMFVACQPVNDRGHDKKAIRKLNKIDWIEGKWEIKTPEGVFIETWERPSDTLWAGVSCMITPQGDTPFSEHIRIQYINDTLYYIPVTSNQNEGKVVRFAAKTISEDEMVYENPEHDFPQRIVYKKSSDNTIDASIEGEQDGQTRREDFPFVKVK